MDPLSLLIGLIIGLLIIPAAFGARSMVEFKKHSFPSNRCVCDPAQLPPPNPADRDDSIPPPAEYREDPIVPGPILK